MHRPALTMGTSRQGQEGGMRRPDTPPEEGEASRDEAGKEGEDQRGGDKRQEREDAVEHESEANIEKEGKADETTALDELRKQLKTLPRTSSMGGRAKRGAAKARPR